MKQYIAKWLPVDGPIEKGDYVKWGNFFGKVSAAGGKDIKKMKPFLCKPKIEVGALARFSIMDEWRPITDINLFDEWIMIDGDNAKLCITDCYFKDFEPIGEISPHAYDYVQDHDLFDEAEVLPMVSGPDDNIFSAVGWDFFTQTTLPKRIAIKGPCGHFH